MERTFLAAALAAAITPALAFEPHNYTYIEAAWVDRSIESDTGISGLDDEIEGDGYALSGSYRTDDGVLFRANYASGDVDEAWGISLSGSGIDIETEQYGLFVGGANQSSDRTSVWGGIGFDRETIDVDVPGLIEAEADADVWYLAAGARYWLTEMVEINGGARVMHIRSDEDELDFTDNDAELSVGLRFQPVSMFSIGASYARMLDAESDVIKADVRLQF